VLLEQSRTEPSISGSVILRRARKLNLERARRGLLPFTEHTFLEFEQAAYHAVVCEFLTKFSKGLIPRGMLFMPPRHTKSELTSRRLPALILGQNPDAKIIATSYNAELAQSMSRDVQKIMAGDRYQQLFPGSRLGGESKQTEHLFEMDGRRGYYLAAGINGGITGMGASFAIIDDPIKNAQEAESKVYRDAVYNWYVSTLYTRLEQPGAILLTMTRWHVDDLAGRLLQIAKDDPAADQWMVLDLPALYQPGRCALDPRSELGEALWPGRYGRARLAKIEKTLKSAYGSAYWDAMYQQEPQEPKGGIFQRAWFSNFVDGYPATLDRVRFWDVASTENGGDWTVGCRVSKDERNRIFIESVVRGQWSPGNVDRIMRQVAEIDGKSIKIVEEQEGGSSGKSVIFSRGTNPDSLQGWDYTGRRATGAKSTRWKSLAAQAELNNVYLVRGAWNAEFIDELVKVPKASVHDDQADASAGGFNELMSEEPSGGGMVRLSGFH